MNGMFLRTEVYILFTLTFFFPREVENIFFEVLLPNSKSITVGTIYRPPNQSNFLEILNDNMNKIDSVNNEIYRGLNFIHLNIFLSP